LGYIELYGLQGVQTMFRGTLRYEGWSETMRRVGEIGLLDPRERIGLSEQSWADVMAELIGATSSQRIKEKVAEYLWLSLESPTIKKFDWLGLFSDKKLPVEKAPLIELLAQTMQSKMMYAEGEKDMIVMHHEFVADYGSGQERITSTLVDYGIPGGDSSMARTVSLPAAIATRLVLQGTIRERGVLIPLSPTIYNPILDELAVMGIVMTERKYPL